MAYKKMPDFGSGNQDLEYLFHPRSIAVVGVSTNPSNHGQRFLIPLIKLKYEGNLYPVGLEDGEINGLRIHKSILDIPGPIDHVICCIPAPFTPQLVEDCIKKKVKTVHFFTSGFSETGEEEGKELEQKLVDIAHRGGIRLIGPNCLGIYCPSQRLTFPSAIPHLGQSGEVGFFCQSGGNSRELMEMGNVRGIHYSKGVSYGNACDLNESELLKYFAQDNQTKIIGAYIEGVKEGERFFKALEGVARIKPTLILKGGRTEAGTRAVASHTGSLAGSEQVWQAICQQTGAMLVDDLDDMIDLMLTFSYLKPPRGRRVGLTGIGGGKSVQSADDCERAGLSLPSFPPEIRERLHEFTPKAGTSVRNPIDSSPYVIWDPSLFSRTLEIVANYDEVDCLLIYIPAFSAFMDIGDEVIRGQIEAIKDFKIKSRKPVVVALLPGGMPDQLQLGFELQQILIDAGIPVYPTVGRAARALSRFIKYHEENSSQPAETGPPN
ncbi:MAG: CoA-binding protein [Chloroflexota bacterium]|nr:CoA-binding protein [Chloroflexota bacterium]